MKMNRLLFIISFLMVVIAFKLNKDRDRLAKENADMRSSIIRYEKAIDSLSRDPNKVMELVSSGVKR